ncbi:hypothetical protein [Clostridium estertheticum]|uniref:hypothetical protein n=1 Tax=Clostridium estertheticum TaxID=238834 RepID=UPI00217CE862|nr:hypothetical protein [Clostridium estertheticum]
MKSNCCLTCGHSGAVSPLTELINCKKYNYGVSPQSGPCKNFKQDIEKMELNKLKEKQEFQLGDTAYMIDEDYRFFESEVYRIELKDGKYYYDTHDIDFCYEDINDWVFNTEMYREIHLESKFSS